MNIGIIGGTGVYALGGLDLSCEQVDTPYGPVELQVGAHAGRQVLFLARHGPAHDVPPHRVNYLANVDALRQRGCACVLATNAVGSLRGPMRPGDLVLPDQFIDFTRNRPLSFHNGGETGVRHVDVTEPYCPRLRGLAVSTLEGIGVTLHPAGTYVCTEGPRFETPAEIRMFAQLGGDLVGMTGLPEVVLAREAGLCYMSVCVVTNFAAGIADGPLREGEVSQLMSERLPTVGAALLRLVEALGADGPGACGCRG